jgi:hypothetical protein
MAYVNEIAKGNYHEAVKIIKEKFPFPASIGHVCPHPCEDACRRQYVEASISIAYLKRFAGLKDLEKDGILVRKQFNEIPPHVEYSLTEKGEDLLPVFYALTMWGLKYIP